MAQIGETELNVHALARALWGRAWLLALLAVIAAAGTYFGLGYVTPLYTADTSILIEERESPLTRPRDIAGDGQADFDESAIQSQVEVLRSREIANAVIDALDLTQRPEFDPARDPSLVGALMMALGMSEDPLDSSIRQRVMERYFDRLSVFPLQRSRVIGVEFSASDPEFAAEVANGVAESFVALQQDAKRESTVAATLWLEQEIDRLREYVAEAEQAVADYRATHDLFDIDQAGAEIGNLSTQQLSDINAELARARAARAEAEARAELVQSILDEGGPIDASEEVLNSQLVQRLRERQGALRAQIAELTTTLLPSHPRIRALEEQVANLEAQIREEAAKVLASLQTAARVAAAREQSLIASLDEAKVDVSRSNDRGIELRALEREAAAQRELLESFLARYREAAARTEADYLPADARIISRAVAPTDPSFPKRKMMALAAAIVVLLVGSAIVLLGEFVSGRAFRVIGLAGHRADMRPGMGAGTGAGMGRDIESDQPSVVAAAGPAAAALEQAAHQELPEEPAVREAERGPSRADEPDEDGEAAEDDARAIAADDADADDLVVAVADADDADADDADQDDAAGTAGLAGILANPSVRVALFSGAEGGEGAGEVAFSAAKMAAEQDTRCVLVDVGRKPSEALGLERPGLGDLLAGDAAFGEVIQRDEENHVHIIPLGEVEENAPLQRMRLVIGALTHTYDKVVVVADKLDDWPDEHVQPDVAAIVCEADASELLCSEVYEAALERGARSAIIVRLSGDGTDESEAA